VFQHDAPYGDPRRHLRHAYLEALQLELTELEAIYDLGLVPEYTYLDLRARLRRDRNSWTNAPADGNPLVDPIPANPFLRLEQTMLKWLRERNSFTWFLARFQQARLSQGIQRDIAGILCGESVLKELPMRVGLERQDIEAVVELYRKRVQRKRERLATMRNDFPEFFASLEDRLALAAALTGARHYVERCYQRGAIGAKAFSSLEHRLERAIEQPPPLASPDVALSAAELIERVPLFAGLSQTVIDQLSRHAQQVAFLHGDVVIGQHDKGNALYILMQGSVDVFRDDGAGESRVAVLGMGDFFGERALLVDEIRNATVRAATPLTLLRLTRKAVQTLAAEHREIADRLRHANEARG
jgi:CPA1 family monovalent cation:H+ antiporter